METFKFNKELQRLLNENKFEEAINFIFDSYQEEHPNAVNLKVFRDKVRYKLNTEFASHSVDAIKQSKLLVYALTTIIGHSEGEAAFNIVLLLLHLLHKGQEKIITDAIELIKIEKASMHLNPEA